MFSLMEPLVSEYDNKVRLIQVSQAQLAERIDLLTKSTPVIKFKNIYLFY